MYIFKHVCCGEVGNILGVRGDRVLGKFYGESEGVLHNIWFIGEDTDVRQKLIAGGRHFKTNLSIKNVQEQRNGHSNLNAPGLILLETNKNKIT